jgi:hypothetical protein
MEVKAKLTPRQEKGSEIEEDYGSDFDTFTENSQISVKIVEPELTPEERADALTEEILKDILSVPSADGKD